MDIWLDKTLQLVQSHELDLQLESIEEWVEHRLVEEHQVGEGAKCHVNTKRDELGKDHEDKQIATSLRGLMSQHTAGQS
jgi:hypothetical protein